MMRGTEPSLEIYGAHVEASGVLRVGWASRLPYFASRGIHSDTACDQNSSERPPGAARDAHPTRGMPSCFSCRNVCWIA